MSGQNTADGHKPRDRQINAPSEDCKALACRHNGKNSNLNQQIADVAHATKARNQRRNEHEKQSGQSEYEDNCAIAPYTLLDR